MLSVSSIVGLPGIPSTNYGVRKWLKAKAIPLNRECNRFVFALSDLPAPERLAYLERSIATLGLPLGTYDDAAHEAFMQAPPSMRENAERKAAMVRLLVSLGQHIGWSERLCLLQRQFGRIARRKPR